MIKKYFLVTLLCGMFSGSVLADTSCYDDFAVTLDSKGIVSINGRSIKNLKICYLGDAVAISSPYSKIDAKICNLFYKKLSAKENANLRSTLTFNGSFGCERITPYGNEKEFPRDGAELMSVN